MADGGVRAVSTVAELSFDELVDLSLHGTEDAFVPLSGAQAAVDLAKSATLVEFPGVGHAPFLEDRDRYLSELTGFLRA